MRKITQITASTDSLCALCDDGTVWELADDKWVRLLAIPQSGLKRSHRDYPDPFEPVPVTPSTEPVPKLEPPPEEGQTD